LNAIIATAAIIITLNSVLCLYRALKGPTLQDRLLGINIVGTKTLTVLVLTGFVFQSRFCLDVAIIYALLNFIVTVVVSRYLETGV
jgi:multicomponent Na+:H+ antiporter subunit F